MFTVLDTTFLSKHYFFKISLYLYIANVLSKFIRRVTFPGKVPKYSLFFQARPKVKDPLKATDKVLCFRYRVIDALITRILRNEKCKTSKSNII